MRSFALVALLTAVSAQTDSPKAFSIDIIATPKEDFKNALDCSSQAEAALKKVQDEFGVSGFVSDDRRQLYRIKAKDCFWWCPDNGYANGLCWFMSGFVCPDRRRFLREGSEDAYVEELADECAHQKAVVMSGLTDAVQNDDAVSPECMEYFAHGLDFACHRGED